MTPNLQFIVYDRAREAARITWYGRRLVIGRRIDADIRINEPTMSGIHAEIVPSHEGSVRIRDLQSLNGTQLNGVRVVESVVQVGDQIQIGRARIVVSSPDSVVVRRAEQHDTDTSIELGSQTLKIRLDRLRDGRAEILEEDRRLVLMRDLSEALKGVEDSQAALDKTRDVLEQAFPRARAIIVKQDESGQWRHLAPDPGARRPSMTFVEETVASNSAILSTSLPDDQRFSASESARISGIETAMAAPTSSDGHPVAVLYLDRLGLPAFSRQDLHILGITANHVSAVLDNVSRIAALRQANQELTTARENLANMNRNLEQLVEERTTEIRRQAEEIQRLAQDKDELLGIAAHDIRGPLTVIQGSSELLRLRFENLEPETLKRTLELMHGAARGLSKLLSELLDAKAIETGKITLHRRRAPLGQLLESALSIAQLAAESKNIELAVVAQNGATIYADPERLGQAITNLVLNAVKFSEPNTRIELRGTSDAGGSAVVEIEDQGIGIPQEELGRLFGKFEQGKAGREAGGSGLGLMIARRLVELHEGELTVESRVGAGTCFRLVVPSPTMI
jgi:signal transduction histidine kinase